MSAKSLRTLMIVLGAVVVLPVVLFAMLRIVNGFDQRLKPEVRRILDEEKPLTGAQSAALAEIQKTPLCEEEELSDAQMAVLLERLDGAALYESLHAEKEGTLFTRCLTRLIRTENGVDFLSGVENLSRKNPALAVERLKRYIQFLLKTADEGQTLLARSMAVGQLVPAVEKAQAWAKRNPRLSGALPTAEVTAFVNRDLGGFLRSVRDNEMRLSRHWLSQLPNPRWFLITNLHSDQVTPWEDLFGRVTAPLYQPNRTLNDLYDRWNETIELTVKCVGENNCVESEAESLGVLDYVINPIGAHWLRLMSPKTYKAVEKIEEGRTKIRSLLAV
ncbi:MAG: hypothetical protein KF865_06580 [Bdellovibrionaceae bacterium]|nr:hypothetical protein [Pseudobdellovibrionaceae bacterium]